MGKNNAMKSKKVPSQRSQSAGTIVNSALIAAVIAIVVACVFYYSDALGQRKTVESMIKPFALGAQKLESKLHDMGVDMGRSMTAEELLQEGRAHESLKRPQCRDAPGCGGKSVTAEACATDEELARVGDPKL